MSSSNVLQELSNALVAAVQAGGRSVVRVDDGTRLTASGVIWSADGLIVATSHGVEKDEGLVIETHDGARLDAAVLLRDPEFDIAVLKVEAAGLPAIEQAPADAEVGALVLALGRPGGVALQASFGVVGSAGGEPGSRVYHVDATLYPGFSGGALVDTAGQFVGLLNLGWRRGVALGPGLVTQIVDAAATGEPVRRGYLGVGTQPVELSENVRKLLDGPYVVGLLVVSLDAGGPAELAGLYVGDTIVEVEGVQTSDPHDLRQALRRRAAGQAVSIRIVRGGEARTIQAVLGERPYSDESGRERRRRGPGRGGRRLGR